MIVFPDTCSRLQTQRSGQTFPLGALEGNVPAANRYDRTSRSHKSNGRACRMSIKTVFWRWGDANLRCPRAKNPRLPILWTALDQDLKTNDRSTQPDRMRKHCTTDRAALNDCVAVPMESLVGSQKSCSKLMLRTLDAPR